MMAETDTQIRLRRAKDALSQAKETETAARAAFNSAMRDVLRAKERYEELFLQEEREEVHRRKNDYHHTTK